MANFKVKRKVLGMGGARFGDSVDYTDFANGTGRMTMATQARVYKDVWLGPEKWYAFAPNNFANMFSIDSPAGSPTTTRPWEVNFGEAAGSGVMLPTISTSMAGATDARMATTFYAPADADSTVSPSVFLHWTTKLSSATTGSMYVFRVHYDYKGTGGSALGGSSGSILYGASMSTTGSGKLEVKTLGTIPAFQTASPFVSLQLTDEGSHASATAVTGGSSELVFFGLRIRYIANALGAAT